MPANNPNRRIVRVQLAVLLRARLQTTNAFVDGLLAAKVYEFLPWDFKEGLPVVAVHAIEPVAGSDRQALTFKSTKLDQNWFTLIVVTFVNVTSPDGTWTEATAQDRLDNLEVEITNVLSDNKVAQGYWSDIVFEGKTTPSAVLIDDQGYLTESIRVKVKVMT